LLPDAERLNYGLLDHWAVVFAFASVANVTGFQDLLYQERSWSRYKAGQAGTSWIY
jgi:hypothetical protein